MSIQKIINGVIDRERGYVDNPNDPGGATNWGITERTARRHGYTGLMRDLPRAFAVKIYTSDYVTDPGFDRVIEVSEAIAEELVDTGVNMGPAIPGPWLQRFLNVMNNQAKLYPDIKVDGVIGPLTISTLHKYLSIRGEDGEKVLLRALNALQGARYIDLAEKREKSESFVYGWFLNRVEIK